MTAQMYRWGRFGVFGLVSAAGSAGAVPVLSDGFEAATHPTGFRTVAAAPGAPFWVTKGSGGTAFLAADGTFASQALTITNTTTATNYPVVAPFGGFSTLTNLGDSINLTFKFRFLNQESATDSNANFRFGIETSQGTFVTADGQTSTSDNDKGFYVQIGDAAQTTNNLFYQENGGATSILSGSDRDVVSASSTVPAIADNAVHTVSFTLTRNASTIGLSLSIDGGTAVTGTSANASIASFDEIAFSNGFATTSMNFAIDDVVVTATNFTVPEPATAGLIALGAVGALARRTRRPATR